jgi:hypothetical protein
MKNRGSSRGGRNERVNNKETSAYLSHKSSNSRTRDPQPTVRLKQKEKEGDETHLLREQSRSRLEHLLQHADVETESSLAHLRVAKEGLVHLVDRDVLEALDGGGRVIGDKDAVHVSDSALQAVRWEGRRRGRE